MYSNEILLCFFYITIILKIKEINYAFDSFIKLYWFIIKFAFKFFVIGYFANGFHKIFLNNIFTFSSITQTNQLLL